MLRRPEKGIPDNVLREIKLLQHVDHPNVVHLHEVFAMGSSLALSCEYCSSDLSEVRPSAPCRSTPKPVVTQRFACLLLKLSRGVSRCRRSPKAAQTHTRPCTSALQPGAQSEHDLYRAQH